MAIKDKNGTVYKLRGPNPIMVTQRDWDRSKVKFINMKGWRSETVEDERNPVELAKENVIDIGEELGLVDNKEFVAQSIPAKEFIEEIKVEVAEPKEIEPKLVVLEVEPDVARMLKSRGVEYYCAPVIDKRTYVDELYGSTYQNYVYGDKYIFDAIVVEQSDLQLHFWCVREPTVGSVIYKREKEGGERWWRVQELESKTGGFLVTAIVSDVNPDFS